MSAPRKSASDPLTPTSLLLGLLRSLHRPLRAFGFFLPGARGRLLRDLGKGEMLLEQAIDVEKTLGTVAAASERASEEVAANRQAMEKLARIQENRSVQDQIVHQKLQEQAQALQAVSEGNLRLAEREEAVKQREAFAREIGARLQTQIEATTRRQEETQALLKEANSIFAAVQALHEQANQRRRETAEEADRRQRATAEEADRCQREAAQSARALDERAKRLEAFKVQLQARELTLQQSQNRLAAVEQQRGAIEEEIKALKVQRMAEVARGEELVRERERAVVKREEEAATASILIAERERALQERENELDARAAEGKRLEAAVVALQATIAEKEKQIAALDQAMRGLTQHSQELQQLLAGLSARL